MRRRPPRARRCHPATVRRRACCMCCAALKRDPQRPGSSTFLWRLVSWRHAARTPSWVKPAASWAAQRAPSAAA